MQLNKWMWLFVLAFPIVFTDCSTSGQGINLFSIQDDVALGKQVKEEIAGNPREYPLLKENGNEEVYRYVRGLANSILNSGQVAHKEDFAWEVYIIDDDNTLNAFCTPGGYIYVYTGLIKFLDSEDQLAGVMGHEIAHAAQRHSTAQMTKLYGVQTLAAVLTGKSDPGLLEQIALSLVSLKFSRSNETDADNHSVQYLCNTNINAAGAAGFFEKIEGQAQPPEFLSTHPSPANRVQNIYQKAKELNCRGNATNSSEYQRIKALLK